MRNGVVSLLAFFIILLLGLKNYETWMLPVEIAPERATRKPVTKIENPPAQTGQRESTSVEAYIFIAEKNLFTPERKEFPVFVAPSSKDKEVKKPMVRPQVILYGVTIGDSYKSASVSTPGRPLSRGEREIMTVKIGDRIGEYKLEKILPDRIGLEAPEDSFEILLYDARVPKRRIVAKTENKPATVTSTLAPPPAEASRIRPTVPRAPVRGAVSETPVPRAVSPAPVPSTRSRRFTGERFLRERQAPAPR